MMAAFFERRVVVRRSGPRTWWLIEGRPRPGERRLETDAALLALRSVDLHAAHRLLNSGLHGTPLPRTRAEVEAKLRSAITRRQLSIVEQVAVIRQFSHSRPVHEATEVGGAEPEPEPPPALAHELDAPRQHKRLHRIDIEDLLFHSDSAVMMPDYRDCRGDPFHPDQQSTTGLRVIAVCLRQQQRFPAQSILVAGHTDAKGSKAHNLELSKQRASNVFHMLVGDAAAWAANADARHVVEDWQQILGWVYLAYGWDCYPGRVDGDAGRRTRRALRRFVRQWEALGFDPLPEADALTGPT